MIMNDRRIITLRSVNGPNGAKIYIQPCRDPKTGMFPEHIRKVDSKGDMILSDSDRNRTDYLIPENKVFKIESGTTFDLSDPYQKASWEAIKHCKLICEKRTKRDDRGRLVIDGDMTEHDYKHSYDKDIRARYGVAEYYIEYPDEDVNNNVGKHKLIYNAQTFIYQDPRGIAGQRLMCKLLGNEMKGSSDNEVLEYLLDLAKSNPKRIIDLYSGTDTHIRLLLIESIEHNVIMFKNGVYLYNQNILGSTQDSVIRFLSMPENRGVLNLIKQDMMGYETESTPSTITEEVLPLSEVLPPSGVSEVREELKTKIKKK